MPTMHPSQSLMTTGLWDASPDSTVCLAAADIRLLVEIYLIRTGLRLYGNGNKITLLVTYSSDEKIYLIRSGPGTAGPLLAIWNPDATT